MRKFVFCIVSIFLSISVIAQTRKVTISLEDASNGEAVSFATVSLTPKGASKASKYTLSDASGNASLEKVQKGSYTLKAELLGYKTYSLEISVADKDLALGKVKMEQDSQVLDAASVSAVGNPITVKKDTIEYNASSFRTTDNDMLEQLLKKLPGVEVDSDGKVTANGEEIKKITIDGKTFFLDDPSLATKNIPAKIVEKVKVVEKKSDQAMFTGIDDGEEETIIDLSIKRGMMNGWFGNVMGGGGHDIQTVGLGQPARWQGAAMVGNFTDKRQISLILNGNNTNNRGFNDMAGSMMTAMRGGSGGMGRGGGMWGNNSGILTSWMGGLNGVWTLLDGRMDLGGNYLYNGSKKEIEESSSKITYKDDGRDLISDSDGWSNTLAQGHRFGIRLEHKFSDKTSILFEPQFNFGSGSFDEYSKTATLTRNGEQRDSTNRGFSSTNGANNSWQTSGFLLFRQKIGEKAGRTFSVNMRYSYSDNKITGFNQSMTDVLFDDGWQSSFVNQRYDSRSQAASIRARAVYTEPLTDKLFLEMSYQYSWSHNTQDKNSYDSAVENTTYVDELGNRRLEYVAAGETLNAIYSNDITNNSQSHRAGLTLQYQTTKLRTQLGLNFQPTITDNLTNGEKYHSVKYNWAPQAMFSYDINDNTDLRFFYRGRSSQPSTSQLIPVPDNSDPLNVGFGNPYLTPYFTHSLRGMFGHTNKKTFFSIRGHINASMVQDGISNAQWYDAAGVRYSMPFNGPLSGNLNFGYFLNSPIAKSGFSISNMSNLSFTSSASYTGRSEKSAELTSRYYNASTAEFDYDSFNRDFFAADHSENLADWFITNRNANLTFMERLKLTYRNNFVEASVSGRMRLNKPWYTLENASEAITWANQVQAEMLWTIPGGVGINADCSYKWYRGYTTEQAPECVLNAEITKLLFKERFTLSLKCYDILNQSKTLTVTDTDGYHREVRNNTLGRYVMVSLTYRFGNFGKAGQQMGSRRGPGGPGGPGGPRGPMPGPRM